MIKKILKVLRRGSLNTTALGSSTVGIDDLRIAKKYLNDKEAWFEESTIRAYEAKFAEFNQSKHAFSFMGGRVALSACIQALGLKKGDKVIVPAFTCIVVPNAFRFVGVEVVYCDIELDTYGLNYSDLTDRMEADPSIKAILNHHLFGLVCRDYEKILAFAQKNNCYLIDDCTHATGAIFKGIPVGNQADLAFYSSEQSKIYSTFNGGMATTNNDLLAEKLKTYQDQADFPSEERIALLLNSFLYQYYSQQYRFRLLWKKMQGKQLKSQTVASTTKEEEQGKKPSHYGQKMPAALAAIGINQLAKLSKNNERRRNGARRWAKWCEQKGYEKPLVLENSSPVFLRYPVMVDPAMKQRRSAWGSELGVVVGDWFLSHAHPAKEQVAGCPAAKEAIARCINFPTILD